MGSLEKATQIKATQIKAPIGRVTKLCQDGIVVIFRLSR